LKEMEPKDQPLMVALQIRPPNDAELEEGATVIAHKVGDQGQVTLGRGGRDPGNQLRERGQDLCRDPEALHDIPASWIKRMEEEVYGATIQHLVEGVISGYNATVFACGPSGTIKGSVPVVIGDCEDVGESPRTVRRERREMGESPRMARRERRGTVGRAPGWSGGRERLRRVEAQTVSYRHSLMDEDVSEGYSPDEAHTFIFIIKWVGAWPLAGQTQNRGKRMKESAHINHSLLALGNCANALSEKGSSRAQYVNFRDSKLMRLLKDALGWNSCTVLIAHISPASTYFEESRTTMLYTHRAKNIKTR
ncbi:hypothetical protein EGM_12323, partial [Macaca fascicularis]